MSELSPAVIEAFFTPRKGPLSPRETELLTQGVPLKFADGRIAATEWGRGPTILLAHGWESRRTHWSSFIPRLVEAGYRAVAIDAPAHGESEGTQTHVVQYANALVPVGRELGPLAAVIAHSWGSAATVLALHRGLQADRVALLSGPSSLVTFVYGWQERQQIAPAQMPAFLAEVEQRVGEQLDKLDLLRIASALAVPALIVHDERDRDVPVSDGEQLAAAWPGAKLLRTTRYGHRRILLASEVIDAVLSFLTPSPSGSEPG